MNSSAAQLIALVPHRQESQPTDYCATKQGPGRDLVREYLEAVRAEGLRAGLYYSLMDWHHPDWMKCKTDEAARRRMVEFAHAQVRELMTGYGKIDILWYDMAYPLDGAGWQSSELNQRVLEWQPDIVINNRSGVPGDFSTPEQNTQATKGDWESCMTLNDNWGYTARDDNWKTPATVLKNLVKCGQDGGNYLLNIGPAARKRADDIRVMLSLEMLGCYSDAAGIQGYPPLFGFFYPSAGNFIAFVSNLRSRRALREVVSAFKSGSDFPVEKLASPGIVPGVSWSAQLSFWREGYPGVMVTDTAFYRSRHYHEATDTPDRIDFVRMARVVEGLGKAVIVLGGDGR